MDAAAAPADAHATAAVNDDNTIAAAAYKGKSDVVDSVTHRGRR
jgi:hypothetical protein